MRLMILLLFLTTPALACPEFRFCAGETAVTQDDYAITIVAMVSPETAVIRTASGQPLNYATKFLAKGSDCNRVGLCVGESSVTFGRSKARLVIPGRRIRTSP